jgi:membrane-associated phospholipid phosphatase
MVTFLNIWDGFVNWDRSVFRIINGDSGNSFFDAVLPWLRQPYVWAPLYVFVLVFVIINYKRSSLWWIIFFLVAVAAADLVGTYIFKHNIKRPRPCLDPELFNYIRMRIKCSNGYSFTSNHAANHFAMATFFFITLRKQLPRWAWIGFPWAFAVIYAQVYVGAHYPLDVICGSLLGIISGLFTGYTFNKQFGFTIFGNQSIAAS